MRKVVSGETLSGFPAPMYNGLVDLLGADAGLDSGPELLRAGQGVIVVVKNTSGADRLRWENMSLSTTLRFTIGSDGKESVIFNAAAGDPAKPPCILQEPIAANKFGRALIFGYTLARVAAGSASTLAAKPNASNKLAVDSGGSVRLLAAPSPTAESVIPCIVGFGGASGITDLRLSGNALQYFKDGTWTTWTTGSSC